MMMIFVFFCLFSTSSAQDPDNNFDDYWVQYESFGIDHSALKLCFNLNGKITPVKSSNHDHGFECKGFSLTWVEDDKHAHEYCASVIPYHIKAATVEPTGGVHCTFQINLKCVDGWSQLRNKCYKLVPMKSTYHEAEAHCKQIMKEKEFKSQLAEYNEGHLGPFITTFSFEDVWVSVPTLEKDFPGRTWRGVMVVDGGYQYDVRPGTLMMFEPDDLHDILCEYTPPMTMAEMYMMASLYNEIYPMHISENGASFSSSSYLTINQVSLKRDAKGKLAEKFATDDIRERCEAIGNIIGVDSHPMASVQAEFDLVKNVLKNHRFHLTSAFKNAGCETTTYQDLDYATNTLLSVYSSVHTNTKGDYCDAFSFSFHERDRFPTMAAMRAPVLCSLHSFSFAYGECESGWITAKRSPTTNFCHFVYTDKQVTYEAAKKACLALNAALTGFESEEEWQYVQDTFQPGKRGWASHFWLGGVVPCEEDCTDPSYKASWELGVSRNTHFLNHHEHNGLWGRDVDDSVSYRSDAKAFHTHNAADWGTMYYICGKYPKLIVKKNDIRGVKNNG
ncbi:unnamed protein product [Caenorhabditis brenneri]